MAKKKVQKGTFLSIKNASDLQQIFDGAEVIEYEDGLHLVVKKEIPEGFLIKIEESEPEEKK